MAKKFLLTTEANILLDRFLTYEGWFNREGDPPSFEGALTKISEDWDGVADFDRNNDWVNYIGDRQNDLSPLEIEKYGILWHNRDGAKYNDYLRRLVRPAADRALMLLGKRLDLKRARHISDWIPGNILSCVRSANISSGTSGFFSSLAEVYLSGHIAYNLKYDKNKIPTIYIC